MNTSANPSFLSEILNGNPIPLDRLAFFRARTQSRLYDLVITKFLDLERAGKITRAELARRIGRKPEQVTRWLGSPGNWTLETTSDLLLGVAGEELEPVSYPLSSKVPHNYQYPDWVKPCSATVPLSFAGSAPPPEATTTVMPQHHGVRIASTG